MATAEPAPASLGPRYAPDDPTLPKPWKGLIDGSTGILYYWNPETNITQYERPAATTPPLPPGLPPVASTPKLAPIPMARSLQSNGVLVQQGQQVNQTLPQQVQQISQSTQQQGQLTAQHQQGSHMVQATQQQGPQGPQQSSQMAQSTQHQGQLMQQQQQLRQHVLQLPVQQMPQQLGSQTQPQGQQMPQQPVLQAQPQSQGQQMPQQPVLQSQHQGQQMALQQGQHFSHQQMQQMPYQQTPHAQGQQMPQQQVQQFVHQQGQQFPHQQGQQFLSQQVQKIGFPQRDDIEFQQGKQLGISPSQIQQPGPSSLHNMPTGTHSVQIPQMGVPSVQPQQYTGSSLNHPQTGSSLAHLPQTGNDPIHRQQLGGSMGQNQMGPPMMQNQHSGGRPSGLKRSSEEELHGRSGNEFYFNANKDGPMMAPPQPKLSAIPVGRNQQEMRMGGVPPHIPGPGHAGGLNAAPGHGMPNMYHHGAGGQPFPNNLNMRPPLRMLGSSDVPNLSSADVYRRQHEVTATGDNVPAPFMTFEATGFPPEILREIHLAGFSSPTPIQAQTWPIALQSRDVVAIAKTGSGKTLGYLIPALIHLRRCHNNPLNGPTVLVLAPTRELATQIQEEVVKFGRSSRITCTCLYGGAPKGAQIRELDRGAEVVVATPGRLNDILEMKKIDFRQVSFLVLDEADRMLDMGFEPQIRKIVNEIPPHRQTLMYTATWPKEVRKIAGDLLVNPVQVNIGSVDELAANKAITQYVEVVQQMQKQRRLEQILRGQEHGSKVIIFCSTKRSCDQLARSIGRHFGAAAIHGDKSQGERDWVLNQFRSGKSPILVATDVAARGLDIKDIRVVINYDFPTGIEDYVHRIGRTGRAGATGVAYTFISDQDWKYAPDLVKVLEGANQRVPPEVREMAMRSAPGFNKGRGGLSRPDGRWDSGGGRSGDRDGSFGGRGGRRDFFGGRGSIGGRGRGFSGPVSGPIGWGRHDRGPPPQDRYNNLDRRGRYENRRGPANRSRGRSYSRSYSPSPERVRTWDYRRSQSRSRSHSRSRSWTRSRSRSRSYSRSRSRSRSLNRKGSRSRSRSRSHDRINNSDPQNFDQNNTGELEYDAPLERMSPMSPGTRGGLFMGIEPPPSQLQPQPQPVVNTVPGGPMGEPEPSVELAANLN